MLSIERIKVETSPFLDQRPGTSGLRKKTKAFTVPRYVENFIQSTFDALLEIYGQSFSDKTLVVGGDGRFYNRNAIQTIIKMAIANGFAHVLIGRTGVVSTPAVSAIIRRRSAFGGFILSASHNPGGLDEDFGIKYNIDNGGPAPAKVTEAIYQKTKGLSHYWTTECEDIDIDKLGSLKIGQTAVEVIDPLSDYTDLMRELFDFPLLEKSFREGFQLRFDAMNAATGPYATHILENILGAPKGTVVRSNPLEDFGGCHPDPNQVYASDLIDHMNSTTETHLGAASDGDGDRNLILGQNCFVSPGDSLAVIAQYACECIPGYKGGIAGVARSMPTSQAADKVAAFLGVPCFETPTGWKFFGNLMDAGMCTLCGEESFGTGSNHVREKDGLWAVLCWMSILAKTKKSVAQIMEEHWKQFGRFYFQRHDFEGVDGQIASKLIDSLKSRLPSLPGQHIAGLKVSKADDFSYTDPVDHSQACNQGLRFHFGNDYRLVCRLSGTGTTGATLRIYYERYVNPYEGEAVEASLSCLVDASRTLLKLKENFGREEPDVVT